MGTGPSGRDRRVVGLHADDARTWAALGNEADRDPHALRDSVTTSVAELLGSPPGLELTSSCTHAMEAASVVLGIGPGDEVIVPAFTFPSTANAFLLSGATIRFADVEAATGNLDPASVERLAGPATRLVVCTHYGGVACDMDALAALAAERGFHLVEDAAHGLFGSHRGIPLGRCGTIGAISFHRTKNLSSIDGGAIVVNDPELVGAVRVAIDKGTNRAEFEQGRVTSYEWSGPGSAWRMPDPMVAVLDLQLSQRDEIQRVRQHAWARYANELKEWAHAIGARLPEVPEWADHPAHLYWVVLPPGLERDVFVAHCSSHGVQTARHYGSLPESQYGSRIRHPDDKCPVAGELGERLVRLPVHQDLTDDDIDRVVDAVTRLRPAVA